MAETSEGHVESAFEKEVTPAGNLGDGTEGRTAAPSHVGVEKLKAQKREINEAGQQLVQEYAEVDQEIERRRNDGRARAVACDMNQTIITDGETLRHFIWTSQNITTAMALLHGLPEATTPKDRWAHYEIRMLLEHVATQ